MADYFSVILNSKNIFLFWATKKKTMKKLIAPTLLSIVILITSCTKDKNNVNSASAIDGTYKFTSVSASTNSTLADAYGGKMVTTSDYTSINNGGTAIFNNGSLTATGLTYTVDAQAKGIYYQDGAILDSSSYPFAFTLPSSNSVGQYKIISSDSIYFPQGGLTTPVDGSNPYPATTGGGGQYKLSGKTLTITQQYLKDSTFTDSGETYNMEQSATTSIMLEKQ